MWGAIAQAGSQMLTSAWNIHAQNEWNNRNWDRQKWLGRNQLQMRVQDAKKAGINPLYALGAPTMSPVQGVAPQASNPIDGNVANAIDQAVNAKQIENANRLANQQAKANIEATKAQARMYDSSAYQNFVEASKNTSDVANMKNALQGTGKPRLAGHEVAKPKEKRHDLVLPFGIKLDVKEGRSTADAIDEYYDDFIGWLAGAGFFLEDVINTGYNAYQRNKGGFKKRRVKRGRSYGKPKYRQTIMYNRR